MDVVKLSKRLSYVLRHRPDSVGLTLEPGGWVAISDLLRALRIDRAQLERVVVANDKQRFAIEGDRIRASQGHSVDIDLGLAPVTPPDVLFHGTATRNLPSIRELGLVKGRRHHVHLSADKDTARRVGARYGKPVVLTVDAAAMARDGHVFYRSANGVWLTDQVPAGYLGSA